MLKNVLAVSAALLLFGSNVMAQVPVRACVADIRTLCKGVEPGEGRIAGCVKEHFKDLSTQCQNWLGAAAAAAKACTADVKQHCAEERRRAAKITCLKSALVNLSDDCKSAISQLAAGRR
jgi:hypothetical protein